MSSRRMAFVLVTLLVLSSALGGGCLFGKKGGGTSSGTIEPSRTVRDTNVVADSVVAERGADGAIAVRWRTKTPTAGGHALAATLFFENRPLYSRAEPETVTAPSLEHSTIIKEIPPGIPAAVAIAYGDNELTDNGGFGYIVKEAGK